MEIERELFWGGTGALKSCAKVTPDVHYEFIFTTATYGGFMMSSHKRLVEEEANIIESIETKMKALNCDEPYQLFKSYQKDYPEILETRVLMTQFVNQKYQTIGAIWFDDGTKDITSSLREIYNKINWKKARDFDY